MLKFFHQDKTYRRTVCIEIFLHIGMLMKKSAEVVCNCASRPPNPVDTPQTVLQT
jgi:hypothetical protein